MNVTLVELIEAYAVARGNVRAAVSAGAPDSVVNGLRQRVIDISVELTSRLTTLRQVELIRGIWAA